MGKMTADDWARMKYFRPDEFVCKCGCGRGADEIDRELVEKLDKIRGMLDKPVIINSAYRCKKHNAEVGGVSDSAHTTGKAVDLKAFGAYRVDLLGLIMAMGFRRVGVGKTFIHADVDDSLPDAVWTY